MPGLLGYWDLGVPILQSLVQMLMEFGRFRDTSSPSSDRSFAPSEERAVLRGPAQRHSG